MGLLGAALLALAACGGEDSGSAMGGEASDEAPPVSAAREGAGEAGGASTAPEVAECLDLVQAGELEQAVSVCAAAAKAAPQNAEVQEALREARAGASEGAEKAAEEAKGALGEASESMP